MKFYNNLLKRIFNPRNLFIGVSILTFLTFISVATGATLQGFQGGTGFATSSVGNVGKYLIVASTSPFLTYDFASGANGITSLNGLTTSSQFFATTTNTGIFNLTSTGNTHTLTIPSNVGFFSNDKNYVVSSSIAGINPILWSSATGSISCSKCIFETTQDTGVPTQLLFFDGLRTATSSGLLKLNSSTQSITAGGTFLANDIGTSTSRVNKVWTSDLDATIATIGTLTVSSVVSGDLVVNNGNINIASTSNALQFGAVTVLNSSTLNIQSTTGKVSSTFAFFGTVTSTNLTTTNLNVTNGNEYRQHTASIVITNPSSTIHSNGYITFGFPVAATLNNIECYSQPTGTSTMNFDRRGSSTPTTAGTEMLNSVLVCGAATGTTSFATTTMTAGSILNVNVTSTAGQASSTNIRITFTNND